MKKTVITLLAAGTMLGAPFSTAFAEEQASQKEVMDKMEVQQKNWNEEQGSPSYLSGELSDKKVETQKAVKEILEEIKNYIG